MQFSFKKINIESPTPTTQFGHSVQTYLVEEYRDHLYARVCGFKNEDNWIIHVSLDLLCMDLDHRNYLQEEVRKNLNNEYIHLITSTTHTHYANNPTDSVYQPWLMKQIIEGICSMEYAEYEDVRVSYHHQHTNAVGKSRISGYDTMLENLCLISFYSEDNNFLNIIINNCHPTTLAADSKFFSAEYPGYVLKMLEDNCPGNYTFIQGAAGDISSRFTRTGQNYEDMVIGAEKLYGEITEMIGNNRNDLVSFKLEYKEIPVTYDHDFSPIDMSKLRSDLSDRERETIEIGQKVREKLFATKDDKGNLMKIIRNAVIASLDLGAVKIIFFPNEIFSAYMDELDLDKEMLVSYSNGYGPYVLPIDFPYVTYEMFADTLSKDCKIKLKEIIKTI